MRFPCFDDLLHRLGLMRKADVDKTVAAIRRQAKQDARLAATLAEECHRLQEDNDQLSDENARLIGDNEGAAARISASQYTSDMYRKELAAAHKVIEDVFDALRQPLPDVSGACNIISRYWNDDEV